MRARQQASTSARRWGAFVLLFAAVFALYAPSVRNGFVYDDLGLILRQAPPASPGDLFRVFGEPHGPWPWHPYYRPLSALSMNAQKAWHGDRSGPYHVLNVALGAGVALLALALLRFRAFGIESGPAWLAAAVFALHPIASSCVYPISGREALLCAAFVLAAMLAHLRGGIRARGVALVAFAGALLSREQGVVVLPLFVWADVLGIPPNAPGWSLRRWLLRYLPVLGVAIVYFALRQLVLAGERPPALDWLLRLSGPLSSLAYLLQTSFVPFVELVYEPRLLVWASAWRLALALALFAALGLAAWRSRDVSRPGLLFWLGWIPIGLAPTANLFRQETPYAERHLLLSLLGIAALAAMLASAHWRRARIRRAAGVVGVTLLLACAAVSLHRGRYFADDRAFLEQWVGTDPRAVQAQMSLGDWHERNGSLDEAANAYRAALALWPRRTVTHVPLGRVATHRRLGVVLLRRGDVAEALAHLESAARLDPRSPRAHYELGRAYERSGDRRRATARYRRALALDPGFVPARRALAGARGGERRREEGQAGRAPRGEIPGDPPER